MTIEAARAYLADVPALTIRNPWPVAILWPDRSVAKTVENRPWLPGGVTRFMLHAGKRWDPSYGLIFRLMGIPPGTPPGGAIVAVVDIARVCSKSANRDSVVCDCGPWARAGQHHWHLTNAIALPEPVKCEGRLRFWQPGWSLTGAVVEQLAGLL